MKSWKSFAWGISISALISSAVFVQHEEKENRKDSIKKNRVDPPPEPSYQNTRGYDYQDGGYHNYSDEELRMIREKQSYKSNGDYIYTPARDVPTRGEEIENYLEDNPGVLEEFHDKYRD